MDDPSGIVVQRLGASHREQIARHLLRLPADDRRLRFGGPINDASIEAYVAGIEFARDDAFGVLAADLELIGVAHLAPDASGASAELGLSVDASARGKGYGYALLQRAVLHATNRDYRVLFMHCLAENSSILHMARKAGLTLVISAGEADGRLELRERTQAGALQEMIEDQFALVDSLFKHQYSWLGKQRQTAPAAAA